MSKIIQPLLDPIDAIVFDCDGTLSTLEGIDELAKQNGVVDEVSQLTQQAMSVTGINPDIYRQRIELVRPSKQQVLSLGQAYFDTITLHTQQVINIFQKYHKTIYILSAGIYDAVVKFATLLNIAATNVFAVSVHYDQQGQYQDYDHQSLLTQADGKLEIVKQLQKKHATILHMGDGLNDYATYHIVTRFVGYGGAFHRQRMAELCQYYISTPSTLALLPLTFTQQEYQNLTVDEKKLYQQGFSEYSTGDHNV